jgi:hypothetical protein
MPAYGGHPYVMQGVGGRCLQIVVVVVVVIVVAARSST